jgi:hypothetical protein
MFIGNVTMLYNEKKTPTVPVWQTEALDELTKKGVINTPEYWRPRLGRRFARFQARIEPVTAGEMFCEFCLNFASHFRLVHAKMLRTRKIHSRKIQRYCRNCKG